MSTHNICFCGEIRKILSDYPILSGAMTTFRYITKLLLITKTCLYNFDPLKPHFYIVKLGFTGVYIVFLISAQNIDCGTSYV